MKYDVCVVGGFGHVGLPLSIAFATKGVKTCALDISNSRKESIESGKMPFIEDINNDTLLSVLKNKNLTLSITPADISESKNVIITIGTPLDEHGGPKLNVIEDMINSYFEYFRDDQLIILRSTVYPNTTNKVSKLFSSRNKHVNIAFCPERIVEGKALKEIFELPQIIGVSDKASRDAATELFKVLTKDVLVTGTLEAELSKLLSNAWRYIKFSAANQFFMMCDEAGVDFYKVLEVMQYKYPRAQDLPKAGFAAGPCLFKDTSQLSAFNNNRFVLGNAAISVNEGLPYYIVSKLKERYPIENKTVGILGMAFKNDIDDPRDSLSYVLKNLLQYNSKKVFCSDPYIQDPEFLSTDELIKVSEIIIIATPHKQYKSLNLPKDKILVDVWNFIHRS